MMKVRMIPGLLALLALLALPGTMARGADTSALPAAPAGEWQKVAIEGALCRDGSPANLQVRYSGTSPNLVIYMEGGGACFNAGTCMANPSNVSLMNPGSSGIFADDPENPVADWNMVYIPYCTGDVFSGTRRHVDVPGGPADQQFVGYTNMTLMLQRIVPTFADAKKVLLTGVSAGGFGSFYNYDQTAEAFGDIPVTLLDDSGLPLSSEYIAPCLQKLWSTLWGWEDTVPAGCADCTAEDGGALAPYLGYLQERWPDRNLGFISSEADFMIRTLFGYGNNECQVLIPYMEADRFRNGLLDAKANLFQDNMRVFFVEGQGHTMLSFGRSFYESSVDGITLNRWTKDLLEGRAESKVAF